jgi:mannosyltransferase
MVMNNRAAESRTISRQIVGFLVFLAFFLRIEELSRQSLWRDEVDTILFASNDLPVLLSMFTNIGHNGALYFLLMRPWFRLLGSSEFALRYPSLLFGVLSVPLFWQVGRRLMPMSGDRRLAGNIDENDPGSMQQYPRVLLQVMFGSTALLATIFLVFNPYLIWYSQEGRMYALVVLLALLAAWFWLEGIDRGGWRPWLGYFLTVTLSILVHRLTLLLIPLGLFWFVLAWPQSKCHWRGYLLALGALITPYLPVVWQLRNVLKTTDRFTGLDFVPLPQTFEGLLTYQSQGISPGAATISLLPIFLMGTAGLFLGFRAIWPDPDGPLPSLSAPRRHLLIASWLILPVAIVYLVSLRQPLFLPRYLIWTVPATMMLMALGIGLVRQRRSPFFRSLTAALALYVVAFWLISGWQAKSQDIKTDLRGAINYVSQHRQADELLILQIPHLEFSYRYYTGDQGPSPFEGSNDRLGKWVGGPWTNNELGTEDARREVDKEMHEITAGAENIWIIWSESETWDSRRLMDEWFDQNATLVDEMNFPGARVTAYRLIAP